MDTIDLNGKWFVKQSGKKETIRVIVPGSIHTDLLAAKKIQDPYFRDNEEQMQWIGRAAWIYSRRFSVTPEFLQHDRILLQFDGLDTLAVIRINSREIARTDNMFRTWEFDIKPFLRPGDNTIDVRFNSTIPYIKKREKERHLPAWKGVHDVQGGNWVRKEQCNYGWDWGPVLVTCGIWRPVRIIAFSEARLDNICIRQKHSHGTVTLDITVLTDAILLSSTSVVIISVTFQGKEAALGKAVVKSGKARLILPVQNPQLWWPNGMGKQPLYEVNVKLIGRDSTVLDTKAKRIGLRNLRLVRKKDKWGESFHFSVNGIPFFSKGADWIPADTFAPRLNYNDYARLIEDAVKANMNMLRVWGGGIYENDIFYNLCDEQGICIWQDFMFACAAYPSFDKAFMENIRQEASDNIRRLRHHACLALWCGNNELEQGLVGDTWSNTQMSWPDYSSLFDNLLPDIVAKLDPDRDYWPCSPHSPHGDRTDFNNPEWGDAHLWNVWHGRQPFEWYRTAMHRFVSEFGFQSFPHPATIRSFTKPTDRNIASYVMEHHQRSNIGNPAIISYLLDWYRLPKDFEMTVWLSQILQGMAMKYAVEHWRRYMPQTMGSLYWQLNDCWPAVSWSSIDSQHRWKALHYMARRFYTPLLVSAVEDQVKNNVAIFITSDLLKPNAGKIRWQITDIQGSHLDEGEISVHIPPGKSRSVKIVDAAGILKKYGPRNFMFWVELEVNGEVVSSDFASFARPKHLELLDPEIQANIRQTMNGSALITLNARKPALWAWLDLKNTDARFSDNFFHLQPHKPVSVEIITNDKMNLAEIKKQLQVRSLFDTYD